MVRTYVYERTYVLLSTTLDLNTLYDTTPRCNRSSGTNHPTDLEDHGDQDEVFQCLFSVS